MPLSRDLTIRVKKSEPMEPEVGDPKLKKGPKFKATNKQKHTLTQGFQSRKY